MRLEDYWGVGPKTATLLAEELGVDTAVAAIESADGRALTAAGLSRGRATGILRHANGGEGLAVLATADTRSVYKELLDRIDEYAVTRHAADRIRVLTPLRSLAAVEDRLDAIEAATASWRALDDATRTAVLRAFDEYDDDGGTRADVELTLALREAGATGGAFAPLDDPDADALSAAAAALAHLDGGTVREGADDELDRLRGALAAAERLEGGAFDVIDDIRSTGVHDFDEFQRATVRYLTRELDVHVDEVRAAMPDTATDAADYVGEALRTLRADLAAAVEEREAAVLEDLEATVEAAREAVDAAVAAVDRVTLHVSLARFAIDFDLARPEVVADRDALAVVGARNLALAAADEDVQPVTYGIGDHDLDGAPSDAGRDAPGRSPPTGDRVAVVTGANSGGKTTLLETLCQVALLAAMGLPVPAERAQVSLVDAVVFHRRHASFNAGVLESTLRSVVPPLAGEGRTLMLVDEFEAITEPGRAADLLHGLVTLTVDHDSLGVFVTHLADDLNPLPPASRTDGIFAEGLAPDLSLEVDYQPRFDTVGKSTPEFIVSRLIANADDRAERAGFETLAVALGETIVQRTLADARWTP